MRKILIIDYDVGNIDSVKKGIEACGGEATISYEEKDFELADKIILPGVGSYGAAMKNLQKRELESLIHKYVTKQKKPLLGICLGMQILSTRGFEDGVTKGLDLIKGEVVKFVSKNHEKIPHVGWNNVFFTKSSPISNEIKSGKDFYFVHSYYFKPDKKEDVLAWSPYCGNFASIVNKDNIFGVQFHPEKSQKAGLQLLKNFIEL